MKTSCYLAVLLVIVTGKTFSQDPIFLNSNQSLINFNPSFAGSNGLVRTQSIVRNQWPNSSSRYLTFASTFDAFIKPINGAIAVSYLHDDIAYGTLKTDIFSLTYAQHLNLFSGNVKIVPSVQISYGRKEADLYSLHFRDMLDPRRGLVWNEPIIPYPKKSYLDFSTGFLTSVKKDFYLGAYIFHWNQPDEGLLGASRLPFRLLLHSSYTIHFKENCMLQLQYRFDKQQNYFRHQATANVLMGKYLVAGLSYVTRDIGQINLGCRTDFFTINLGYDVSLNRLAGNSSGSYELGATFNLRNKENRRVVTNFESM